MVHRSREHFRLTVVVADAVVSVRNGPQSGPAVVGGGVFGCWIIVGCYESRHSGRPELILLYNYYPGNLVRSSACSPSLRLSSSRLGVSFSR